MGGKRLADHLNIMETTTDDDGYFYFEGWEQNIALWGFFIDRDPELLFYKKGYEYRSLKNPNVLKLTPVKFVNQLGTEKR